MTDTQSKEGQVDIKPSKISDQASLIKPLVCFCVLNFFLNAGISVIAPFYPLLAEGKAGLSATTTGYIFSFNPIGAFCFSFILGNKMETWGRKQCMIIGLFLQAIAIISYGFLELVADKYNIFIICSLIIRFVQGASWAAYTSISLAYVPQLWPDSIPQKISILESLTGLGLVSGPFLGALLDYYFGYQYIFYILGGIFFLSILPTITFIPDDNKNIIKEKISFNWKKVLQHKWIISLSFLLTMMATGTTFLNPLFSVHMKQYGVKGYHASLILGYTSIIYIGSINFVPSLFKYSSKKALLVIGILLGVTGVLLLAPIFVLPQQWWIVLIALPFIGLSNSLCVVPSIPQYAEYMNQILKDNTLKKQVYDLTSGLFVSFYSLGNLIGPLFGGILFDQFLVDSSADSQLGAFQKTCYVIASIMFLSSLIYIIFGNVINIKTKNGVLNASLVTSLQSYDATNDSENQNL